MALLVLLLVAAALVAEPFANVGRRTSAGYAYRKYFTGAAHLRPSPPPEESVP